MKINPINFVFFILTFGKVPWSALTSETNSSFFEHLDILDVDWNSKYCEEDPESLVAEKVCDFTAVNKVSPCRKVLFFPFVSQITMA